MSFKKKTEPQINADEGAQSHEPPESRLGRARPRMPAGIRVVWETRTVRFRSRRVHVCPAGHTCARSREPAGFRHDERRLIDSNIQYIFVADADNDLIISPQSSLRPQSIFTTILALCNGNYPSRRRTRIRRMFTDTVNSCVSAFICVHLRLIRPRLTNGTGGV
ncbi:Uncharacterised protein [uncultured archaeon]|nr:Uncharacterised protein [uncultured archaeon]